ncbi:hypothetical protein BpHYR1_043819 [Brachionus plicatilis]|uniref:Uncharacterized protein n=1 Tax=Brachionus plicatilis TaxID=10195 RepID=A0A3M7RWB2_BRAPC|nr:hypothetical protein BpHYR1_043819 [Brachionus plicatilis]
MLNLIYLSIKNIVIIIKPYCITNFPINNDPLKLVEPICLITLNEGIYNQNFNQYQAHNPRNDDNDT